MFLLAFAKCVCACVHINAIANGINAMKNEKKITNFILITGHLGNGNSFFIHRAQLLYRAMFRTRKWLGSGVSPTRMLPVWPVCKVHFDCLLDVVLLVPFHSISNSLNLFIFIFLAAFAQFCFVSLFAAAGCSVWLESKIC